MHTEIAREHHISAMSVGNIALKAGLTCGRRYTGDELVQMIVAWFVGDDVGESEREPSGERDPAAVDPRQLGEGRGRRGETRRAGQQLTLTGSEVMPLADAVNDASSGTPWK